MGWRICTTKPCISNNFTNQTLLKKTETPDPKPGTRMLLQSLLIRIRSANRFRHQMKDNCGFKHGQALVGTLGRSPAINRR